jgi:hypothetical protein
VIQSCIVVKTQVATVPENADGILHMQN